MPADNHMSESSSKIIVLLTGAGGLFGRRLADAAPSEYDLYRHYHRFPDDGERNHSFAGDLCDSDHMRTLADRIDPDIIINSAALADVDRCETEPELSYRVNAGAARNLLDRFPDAKFVQISTDYVFSDCDKRRTALPRADDETDPVNVYGRHKLEAEHMALAASRHHLIIRVNSLFDYRGRKNIFSHVLANLSGGKRIDGFTDQISNPISTITAAEITMALIQNAAEGVFHVGGREIVSRYEFACRIADYFGYDSKLVTAATSVSRSRPARRPTRAGLDCHSTETVLGISMPDLEDEFARLRAEMDG